MLKRILGLLAAACVALATGPTSIVDTLYFPIGASGTQQTFTGKLTIAWQNFTPADGVTLIAGSETLTITSGVLSIQLEPTDTAVPSGESYSVTWTQNGTRASYTQYCSVPTSATAIKWNRLGCTTVVPTPNITVNLSQINPAAMPAVAGTGALAVTLGAPGLVSGNPTDCVMVDGSSGACGGISSVQVEANGTSVGTRPTLNFLPGLGQLYTISDTGTAINIENGIDAATVPTFPVLQSGSPLVCASASNSTTTYTCSMSPTLTKYTVGMVLDWIPDVNGAGGATTLRVDSLAATPIKEADGTTNPSAADIVATSMRQVWYDGANFRFIALEPSSGTGGVVSSVFGRTGAVTAQMGDYAAGQVTNAAATNASNTFTAGTQDFSGAAHTKPVIVVASVGTLPATCSAGELAFVSGATAGQQIYECSATNQWTQQVAGSGGGGSAPIFSNYESLGTCTSANVGQQFYASNVNNKHWACDGTTWQPIAFDMRVVEPTTLTWATATNGSDSPTVTNVAGTVQMEANIGSGSENFFWFTAQSLATPYTIEVAYTIFVGTNPYVAGGCGVYIFSTNTTSALLAGVELGEATISGGGGASISTLTMPNDGGGVAVNENYTAVAPVMQVKLTDTGSVLTAYLNNGSGWTTLGSISYYYPTSAPYWGFTCSGNGTSQYRITLYHANVHN